MSTRYVWEEYNTTQKEELESIQGMKPLEDIFPIAVASDYIPKGPRAYEPVSPISSISKGGSASAFTFPYIFIDKRDDLAPDVDAYVTLYGSKDTVSGDIWKHDVSDGYILLINSSDPNKHKFFSQITVSYEPGGLNGYKSSISRNVYPDNSLSGSYWYKYLGYDNIDPTAVTYSVNDLYSGDPFTIIVTPRAPTYGGTVYYRYQYSINGGSWTNIGSRTTATSATVTIPEGAEQFQARVLASDGWGFTSSTYVYGPAKEVSQLKAYVGIGEKSVALKKGYVGVGGKSMQLVKGYVGVGGVAKKLF